MTSNGIDLSTKKVQCLEDFGNNLIHTGIKNQKQKPQIRLALTTTWE